MRSHGHHPDTLQCRQRSAAAQSAVRSHMQQVALQRNLLARLHLARELGHGARCLELALQQAAQLVCPRFTNQSTHKKCNDMSTLSMMTHAIQCASSAGLLLST